MVVHILLIPEVSASTWRALKKRLQLNAPRSTVEQMSKGKGETHLSFVMLSVGSQLVGRLEEQCRVRGKTVEELGPEIVEAWLAKETRDARYLSKLKQLTFAKIFIENVPNEACIKDRESRLVWCNDLFRQMAAAASVEELYMKSPFDIWKHDRNRAQIIRKLDLDVIERRCPLCHVDVIQYPDGSLRPRVGIRFPLFDPDTDDVAMIGTLGIDFSTLEEAAAAHLAISIEGKWKPLLREPGDDG